MSNERIIRRSLVTARKPTAPTEWSEFDAQTDADIEVAVRSDLDAAPLADDAWFETARVVEPNTKQAVSIRLDRDVLEWFRTHSDRYQTKMNNVLRAYMEHEKRARTGA
ncbi:uncharacterized protein (DUF4415 family) [Azospirillum agricola]|uniref:BrnA antitoxin family protein n=1 Tax=Azospirillum agricola TaxID=1720247 RepID=UPI001AE6BEA5|nr:BrnA antitoxin family protein [Azospirillum agricola]MBP2232535.1 uncharacterized protein (DUF4415 family) [Azospirillum agricola]